MGELSEQNRALVESALDGFSRAMWDANKHISTSDLNRLLDAARTEGRGDQEPVAWRCFDLIMETTSIIDDAKHAAHRRARSSEWTVQPLYASPIREPEISRAKRGEIEKLLRENLELTCGRNCEREMGVEDENAAYRAAADAILNLAPVGGGHDD